MPKNIGCPTSNTNSLECSAENEADVASNLLLATNTERPVSIELQPALPANGSAQVSVPHSSYRIHNVTTYMRMRMLP